MDQSPKVEKLPSPVSPSLLLELPYDIFIEILDRLSTREAFEFSLVCKAVRCAPPVLDAIYAEPFTQEGFKLRRIKPELTLKNPSIGEDNYGSIKKYVNAFNSSLNKHTGSFVQRLSLWRNLSQNCLLRYQDLCPHLRSIDFTDITAIGWHRQRREYDHEYNDTPSKTRWNHILECSSLLCRLTDIRLTFVGTKAKYGGEGSDYRRDGSPAHDSDFSQPEEGPEDEEEGPEDEEEGPEDVVEEPEAEKEGPDDLVEGLEAEEEGPEDLVEGLEAEEEGPEDEEEGPEDEENGLSDSDDQEDEDSADEGPTDAELIEAFRSQFPRLLRTAQQLQSIEIVGARHHHMTEWAPLRNFTYLQDVILGNAGPRLQTLKLRDLHGVVCNLNMFLKPLETLPKLTTIALSINADLSFLDRDRNEYRGLVPFEYANNQAEATLLENTDRTVKDYLTDLQTITSNPRWKIKCLDRSEDHPLEPGALYPLIPSSSNHLLDWLHQRFSWVPLFTWKFNMRRSERPYKDGYRVWHGEKQPEQALFSWKPLARDQDLESCRALFHVIKAIGLPVRLLLPGDDYYGKLLDSHQYQGKFKPKAPDARMRKEDWYLDRIGDLVDDLRILWGMLDKEFEIRSYIYLPDGEGYDLLNGFRKTSREQLEDESLHLGYLWRNFADFFPHLRRLQLQIPSSVYPARDDNDFIDTILPGENWIVTHIENVYDDYMERTYFLRTFVRADAGGELDSVTASAAALGL